VPAAVSATAGCRGRGGWDGRRSGFLAGVAGASSPISSADVTYIPLTVPHKVLSNAAIATGATNSVVVIGAATTVPSDATSVQMTVAVKSAKAGNIWVFPSDNRNSDTFDGVSFPAGDVLATETTRQHPGLSGKVSFRNGGTATATVTVTITAYSTENNADTISGSGGVYGSVLTNRGATAAWEPIGWAYQISDSNRVPLPQSTHTNVVTLVAPPGDYVVVARVTVAHLVPGGEWIVCGVRGSEDTGTNDSASYVAYATWPQITVVGALASGDGGVLTLWCDSTSGTGYAQDAGIVATRVGN
jgi:hypothetical protein